jgi:transcriptional regulator
VPRWQNNALFIHANPFARLISIDDDDLPFVMLLLHFLVETDETLRLGRCTKPNLHWRYLTARPIAVVTFEGQHLYTTMRSTQTWHAYPPGTT